MLGKLPFPDWALVTNVKVYAEEPTENGVETTPIFDGKCNFSERSKTTLNEHKQVVELTGKMIFKGDIYPDKLLRGYVEIDDIKKTIYKTRKPRNPDGSIYSTELELM